MDRAQSSSRVPAQPPRSPGPLCGRELHRKAPVLYLRVSDTVFAKLSVGHVADVVVQKFWVADMNSFALDHSGHEVENFDGNGVKSG